MVSSPLIFLGFKGQLHDERRTLVQIGNNVDTSMVLFNEFAGYEQSKSGTFSALCAEKGRKKLCLDTVGHTGTIVRNVKADG